MKIKNPYLFILLALFIGLECYAQQRTWDEEKYEGYRERLRLHFMAGIGPEMGMSIPAMSWDTVNGIVKWSDCTIDHGHYLSVLGSEYKILSAQGKGTDETVRELFYALYALNRLDYFAEYYFDGEKSLNGFFVRDDVSEDSLDMEEVLARLNENLPYYMIDSLASDYMEAEPRLKEESLDQAIMLITGLGMVIQCVPPELVYYEGRNPLPFQDFELSIQQEAENIITRIVNYMKEGDTVVVGLNINDPNLLGVQGLNWDFIIKNPVTYEEVFRGANAFFLSTGIVGSKYWLTGQESPTTDTFNQQTALGVFLALENLILPNFQDLKVLNLDAMSNIWPEGMQQDTSFTNYNAQIIGPRSQTQGYEWVPMLHQVVFGSRNYLMSAVPPDTLYYNDPEGYYEYLLNMAPEEGPYNYNDSIYPNWEWSSTSRTIHPERRGQLNTAFTGHYNGLDYMLFRNLLVLNFQLPVMIPEPEQGHVHIYPNPSSGEICIDLDPNTSKTAIRIINSSGQLVWSQEQIKNHHNRVNLSNHPPGIYIVQLVSNHKIKQYQKIIIL